ncbi:PEGA domain-containing protein [Pelagicoccus mobilis]|uniref:PEGA domain-containing protein n=1 Tax=Pelagicoccus mobilis TaxID=415221 RepID=A0A934RWW4_9BACT|nr:PEGA domain-containing protein [Pelagicoccus mobilis]MBK1878006.1 PEGA domain-containing protein [Pelagicoccus mobilis]
MEKRGLGSRRGAAMKLAIVAILFGGVVVAGIVGFRMLMLTPVLFQFEIGPENAEYQLRINETDAVSGQGPMTLELAEGVNRVEVVAPGFEKYVREFEVSSEGEKSLEITLRPLPGYLMVETVDVESGAALEGIVVNIDGKEIGATPLRSHRIDPGVYTITLGNTGSYVGVRSETEVTVKGGGADQELKLEMIRNAADITFRVEPRGANISDLNRGGRSLGVVATGEKTISFDLEQNPIPRIRFELENYQPYAWSAPLVPGQTRTFDIKLSPKPAVLHFTSEPSGANIYIDGQLLGKTPIRGIEIEPQKDVSVVVSKSGYEDKSRIMGGMMPNQSRSINVTLVSKMGELKITSDIEAAVMVDGEFVGFTPVQGEYLAGTRSVVLKAAGQGEKQFTVELGAGNTYPLHHDFVKTPAQAVVEKEREVRLPPKLELVDGLEFILIEPGTFPFGEPGNTKEVTISNAFYVSTTEVPSFVFESITGIRRGELDKQGFNLNKSDYPAVRVSWNDAAFFCNELNKALGFGEVYRQVGSNYTTTEEAFSRGVRLQTEAEYEYLMRIDDRGSPRSFAWGDEWPPPKFTDNFADKTGKRYEVEYPISGYDDGNAFSAQVASFRSHPDGVYNLSGNVREWCHDGYERSFWRYAGSEDPSNFAEVEMRVVKGGSYMTGLKKELMVSYRQGEPKDAKEDDLGFRVVLPSQAYINLVKSK